VHPLTTQLIRSEAELRALIGAPAELTCAKISDRLNPKTRLFIERSPFVCLATSDARGHCDLSPRGDPAGFVRILDERSLLLPERPGNRLADSLRNILANPQIGLLFVVPGVTDTFRVNGRAAITTDARRRGWGCWSTSRRPTRSARRPSCVRACGTRSTSSTRRRCRPAVKCTARSRATASTPKATTPSGPSVIGSGSGSTEASADRPSSAGTNATTPS
jgi:predicted pyridoxine 5'-phosphate oxidase superfamily flavin-nucleotide-binding protein